MITLISRVAYIFSSTIFVVFYMSLSITSVFIWVWWIVNIVRSKNISREKIVKLSKCSEEWCQFQRDVESGKREFRPANIDGLRKSGLL